MRTGRKPDHLDATANVAERVRKLEVMQQGQVYRPNQWRNHETLLDVAAQLVYAQSHWERANPEAGDQWPEDVLDRVGQQMFDILMTHGYETAYWAQQWTALLIFCGAINRCPGGEFGELTGVDLDRLPPLITSSPAFAVIDDAPVGGGAAHWTSSDDRRFYIWAGLSEGGWAWANAGTLMGTGFPVMPGGGLTVDGTVVYRDGNFYKAHAGALPRIWWTGSDTTVWYETIVGPGAPYGPQPCWPGGYDGAAPAVGEPGGEMVSGTFTDGCPDSPRENIPEGGFLSGAYVIAPEEDAYLAGPPVTWMGAENGMAGYMLAVGGPNPGPYYEDLKAQVATGLAAFPGVQEWISRWLPTVTTKQKWHRLARHIRAEGAVEAQVRDRQVVMRGTLRLLSAWTPRDVLVWFDDRQLPPPAISESANGCWMRAHTDDGQIVPLVISRMTGVLFPHVWGISIYRPEYLIDPAYADDPDYDNTLHFDGIIYPTDVTLY